MGFVTRLGLRLLSLGCAVLPDGVPPTGAGGGSAIDLEAMLPAAHW